MDKQQATQLIQQTFENAFDESQYLRFLRELFNGQIDESDERKFDYYGQYIPDAFKDTVQRYKRLGTYTDPDGHEVDLLVVILKRDTALDRARAMQRNFAAYHLKRREKETAIIAYTAEDKSDWRFSMVRSEVKVSLEEGKLKAKNELTPVRRYSFLVGQSERSHTAQQQLFPILLDTQHDPTLARLEDAFNIETVTKEFFERYKALFLKMHEALDTLTTQDSRVQAEFKAKEIDTANFAKKLLGQIVFLYFLQKKGWLGVQAGANWGTGSKGFLRELFERRGVTYDNFFNDVLEPLFYEALAMERPNNLYPRLNVRIPFLNGGLFEPMKGYDWQGVDVRIDNSIFKDIFDTFDLYNFTVREDEPLEKEVAVDPEMLGKVFENLLEVTDRKSKGAFYTPREIVHYMCQESLINYLDTRVNVAQKPLLEGNQPRLLPTDGEQLPLTENVAALHIPRKDIETFIRLGEFAKEHDLTTQGKEKETATYSFRMPEPIRTHAAKLDEALASIKICDPAIGSGAFPVGMMQEIVKARDVLTTHIGEHESRTPYHFKRHAIQESIYGVDIDPGAIDIAKLRLWLSLVVDEDDYQHIKPLPNLDYKIVCGNSLLSVEKDLFNHELFQQLEALKKTYFNETNPQEKQAQRTQINALIVQLTGGHRTFDMHIYFSEVFHNNKGFDVVIGNPPYVRQEQIKDQKSDLQKFYPEVYVGTADLYVYFFAQGLRILKSQGVLTFITPNKFLLASYGEKLRQHLSKQTTIELLIDFGDLHVFDATTYPFITVTKQSKPQNDRLTRISSVNDMESLRKLPETVNNADDMRQSNLRRDGWQLIDSETQAVLDKVRAVGSNLGTLFGDKFFIGLKTAFNAAYVIDEKTRNLLVEKDPRSHELIYNWLRGRDIKRWSVNWSNLYLIKLQSSTDSDARHPWKDAETEGEALQIFKSEYPAVYDHIVQFEANLKQRSDQGKYWWELRSCAYYSGFDGPKIIWPDIAKENQFTLDRSGAYPDMTLFVIPTDDLYLLGVLNSALSQWFISQVSPSIQNNYFRFKRVYVSQIPIADPDNQQRAKVERVVAGLLDPEKKRSDLKKLERELNHLIFEIYGLAQDEKAIALIEGKLDKEAIIKADSALSELTDLEGDF